MENTEKVITEMLRSIWDFFAALGIFTVILFVIGYAWGYFA